MSNLPKTKNPIIQKNTENVVTPKKENGCQAENVVICLEYYKYDKFDEFLNFASNINSSFGAPMHLTQIDDQICVVEALDNNSTLVPNFSKIDESYQNISTIPKLLFKCDDETYTLTKIISKKSNEINKLKKEKEKYLQQINYMKTELEKVKAGKLLKKKLEPELKNNFSKLIDCVYPPSEELS